MIGKLKKLKDELGNYIFPVTSESAVLMEDGTTKLKDKISLFDETTNGFNEFKNDSTTINGRPYFRSGIDASNHASEIKWINTKGESGFYGYGCESGPDTLTINWYAPDSTWQRQVARFDRNGNLFVNDGNKIAGSEGELYNRGSAVRDRKSDFSYKIIEAGPELGLIDLYGIPENCGSYLFHFEYNHNPHGHSSYWSSVTLILTHEISYNPTQKQVVQRLTHRYLSTTTGVDTNFFRFVWATTNNTDKVIGSIGSAHMHFTKPSAVTFNSMFRNLKIIDLSEL